MHTSRTRQLLERASIPVVETWDLPDKPIDHIVGFSSAATIEDLVARLCSRGYRKLGFIGGDHSSDTRGSDRRAGYQRAVKTLGLERDHVLSTGEPPITVEQGGEAVVRLLEEWPDVEVAICVSDLPAFGAIMECHRRGWSVPGRLAVAGFGDFQIARYCWPSITTVSVGCREIGQRAAELMLRAIASKERGAPLEPQLVQVPHSVIERESTSIVPT